MSACYEMFFEFAKPQIKVETDIIAVFTHVMLAEVGFRCLITNAEVSLHCFICHYCIFHMRNISYLRFYSQYNSSLQQSEKKPSTLLPKNWNENSDKYSLRYILGDEAFVMIGTVVDENIILNLLVGKAKENRKNFLCVHNHYNDDHFFKCFSLE